MIQPNSARSGESPDASEAPGKRSFAPGVAPALLAVLLAVPLAAEASDGVLEINHTCAVQTGCFAGDAAGYPITVDGQVGRSYRLTSDLIVPDENTDGIVVSTSDLGIDLNNFTIIRSACVGATTDCTPASGSGSGIERTTSLLRGISVKNGGITGMGRYGVILGEQSEVTGLRLRWNRLDGINVDTSSIVSDNTVYQNGDDGISTKAGSVVSGNMVYLNGGKGVVTGESATLTGNTAYLNGGVGIAAGTGSTVSGNTSYQNGAVGIIAGFGSTVQRNTVRSNVGFGLTLSPDAAYRENVISDNTAGTVSSGLDLGSNACNGSTVCP